MMTWRWCTNPGESHIVLLLLLLRTPHPPHSCQKEGLTSAGSHRLVWSRMKAIAVALRLHHLVLSAQCCSMLQAAAVACPETGNVGHSTARWNILQKLQVT